MRTFQLEQATQKRTKIVAYRLFSDLATAAAEAAINDSAFSCINYIHFYTHLTNNNNLHSALSPISRRRRRLVAATLAGALTRIDRAKQLRGATSRSDGMTRRVALYDSADGANCLARAAAHLDRRRRCGRRARGATSNILRLQNERFLVVSNTKLKNSRLSYKRLRICKLSANAPRRLVCLRGRTNESCIDL